MIKIDKGNCTMTGTGNVIMSEISCAILEFVDGVAKEAEKSKKPVKKSEIFSQVMAQIVASTTMAFKTLNDEEV